MEGHVPRHEDIASLQVLRGALRACVGSGANACVATVGAAPAAAKAAVAISCRPRIARDVRLERLPVLARGGEIPCALLRGPNGDERSSSRTQQARYLWGLARAESAALARRRRRPPGRA